MTVFDIRLCLVNMNIPAPKIEGLQVTLKKQHGDFLQKGSTDFD
jgi:hypothetical protein